jgi:hypothetical protein
VIIRRGGQLQGMGFGFETVLASPAVQQAATQTAGGLLTTVGEGLISLFGDGDQPPPPPPPPPKPTIPSWLPIAAIGAVGLVLLLRK